MYNLIGLITSDLSDPYQAAIWRGVEAEAARHATGLITFVGSIPGSPVPSEATSNLAYRIPSKANVDGLIAVVSTLTSYQSVEAVTELMRTKGNLPWVSIGAKVGNAPSVMVDGRSALGDLVGHLARAHGRRRFALIQGPETHPEVEERYSAVVDALRKEGINLDSRLVGKGDFSPASAFHAVSRLIRDGNTFDALVCMNDQMAIGAIDALHTGNFRVPDDVSVIGFDGIPEGGSLDFPLSTVVQPLRSLGGQAVEMLLRMLASESVTDRKLQCAVLIKETCGCPPISLSSWTEKNRANVYQASEPSALDALRLAARTGEIEDFGRVLNDSITAERDGGSDPEIWTNLLRDIFSECESADAAVRFEYGRSIILKACSRLHIAREISIAQRSRTMQRISATLAASFDLRRLLETLQLGLTELGIGRGYLALYIQGDPAKGKAELAMRPRSNGELPDRKAPFRIGEIVPKVEAVQLARRRWVLLPLVFNEEALGHMVLPGGLDEPAMYFSLRDQISSSIEGALLLERIRLHEQKLEMEVAERTKEIRTKNVDLKAEIKRRAALEKEVVEVSNRTIERIGQDLHDDLSQHLAAIAMIASITEEALEKVGRSEAHALARISSLLRDAVMKIKQIARGLIATGLEAQGLSSAIESLVDSVSKSYNVAIRFRTVPEFLIDSPERALQIYRIVQEALLNAVRHSGSNQITVELFSEPAHVTEPGSTELLCAEVTDKGLGDPDNFRAGGLGLRIMKYRAQLVGATLSLLPNFPGTRVVCRFSRDGAAVS